VTEPAPIRHPLRQALAAPVDKERSTP